jgi:hypothetical protein
MRAFRNLTGYLFPSTAPRPWSEQGTWVAKGGLIRDDLGEVALVAQMPF